MSDFWNGFILGAGLFATLSWLQVYFKDRYLILSSQIGTAVDLRGEFYYIVPEADFNKLKMRQQS